MNTLFDTSFLCALHNESDPHFAEATKMFSLFSGSHILIPTIVMAEFLIGDVAGDRMIATCRKLCGSFLSVTEKELSIISSFPYPLRKKLKSNDSLVLAHAIANKAELFTFDHKLLKAYKGLDK